MSGATSEIAIVLCCQKVVGVHQLFRQVLMDTKLSIRFVNKDSKIQNIREKRPHKSLMAHAMPHPSAFEVQLYFHALMFLEQCA